MSEEPVQALEPEDRLGMTEEQWERFQAYTHGFGEQDENGVDVSLLRENLRLTPSQRLERLVAALESDGKTTVIQPQPSFRTVLAALHARNVRFVLIGGLAMIVYGSDYFTQDVDVIYA